MSLVGLAAQHSPLAFSPLMERHTLQYSSSPSLGLPSEGEEFFIYTSLLHVAEGGDTPKQNYTSIIQTINYTFITRIIYYTYQCLFLKSRPENVITVVKSRAENVMIYFSFSSGKVAFAAF